MKVSNLQIRRPPAASDAEIRAYLHPLLKAGRPPTYETMRATLGGGFSRLARIKKQIERELAGHDGIDEPGGDPVHLAGLVATLEALVDRQRKALLEWERRSAAQAERFEAVEQRLLAMLDQRPSRTKK
jgi:hypothetical protein